MLKGGLITHYQPDGDYWRRVWLPDAATDPRYGIPLSLDFEDLAERFDIPNPQLVQRSVWKAGFVTPADCLKAGVHAAFVHALLAHGYGDKRACKEAADRIVREIRKDLEG